MKILCKPGRRPEPADDEIYGEAGEASAFAGAVEIDEERALLRATGLKPRLERLGASATAKGR